MEWSKELLDIFDDPILENVRPKPIRITPDDRRVKTLFEIAEWSKANDNKVPQSNGGTLKEKMLARSLMALKRDAAEGLTIYDELNLLKEV